MLNLIPASLIHHVSSPLAFSLSVSCLDINPGVCLCLCWQMSRQFRNWSEVIQISDRIHSEGGIIHFQQHSRAHAAFYSSSSVPNVTALFFMLAPALQTAVRLFLSMTRCELSWTPLFSLSAEAERVFRVTVQMKSSTQLFQAMAVGLSPYVGYRSTAGESFFTAHIKPFYAASVKTIQWTYVLVW